MDELIVRDPETVDAAVFGLKYGASISELGFDLHRLGENRRAIFRCVHPFEKMDDLWPTVACHE